MKRVAQVVFIAVLAASSVQLFAADPPKQEAPVLTYRLLPSNWQCLPPDIIQYAVDLIRWQQERINDLQGQLDKLTK